MSEFKLFDEKPHVVLDIGVGEAKNILSLINEGYEVSWQIPNEVEPETIYILPLTAVETGEAFPFVSANLLSTSEEITHARKLGADSVIICHPDNSFCQYLIEVAREVGMEPILKASSREQAKRIDAKIWLGRPHPKGSICIESP